MNPASGETVKDRKPYTLHLTLAAVTGQVGCLTLCIVLAALFIGLWLDGRFHTRPIITVGLMIISVPVTMVTMVWMVKRATSRLLDATGHSAKTDLEDQLGKTS